MEARRKAAARLRREVEVPKAGEQAGDDGEQEGDDGLAEVQEEAAEAQAEQEGAVARGPWLSCALSGGDAVHADGTLVRHPDAPLCLSALTHVRTAHHDALPKLCSTLGTGRAVTHHQHSVATTRSPMG